jgi:hypothetical protein
MSNLYKMYQTDTAMESEVGITLAFDEVKIHVKRAGGSNKKFSEVLRRLTNPVRRQIQNDTISPDKVNTIFMQVYARAVVLGWENVTDENDNPLPFTEENFVKVMTDLPDFWAALQEECAKVSNFRQIANEEDGTHLGNSSSGTSSGGVH